MITALFIIHSSPIIQKGIEALIASVSNIPIQNIQYPSDIMKRVHASHIHFIVFTQVELTQEYYQALHALQKHNEISYVQILDEQVPVDNRYDSYVITHYSSVFEIEEIIHTIEQKNKNSQFEEHGEQLSVREKEVLTKVALGFSNKEIAEQLSISVHTVISHRKKIVEKTGIKSNSGLKMNAIMTKIIDPTTIDISKLI